jgi:two-component system nitrate/nitrite response regulator NarL
VSGTEGSIARIMICSRRPMLVKALADHLQRAGFDVIGVDGTARGAHMAFRRHRPDVVITDEWPAGTDHLVDDLNFALLLLSVDPAEAVVNAWRRTVLVAERSATLHEVVTLVAELQATQDREMPAARLRSMPSARPSGSRRLARFLSPREREVLSELVRGADTTTLARRLAISRSTARDHIQSVLTKMNAHSRLELVSIAVKDRLVDPTTGLWLYDVG